MLISCPECRREVSDSAPACLGCGYPIASRVAQTGLPVIPGAIPGQQGPTMAGSFALGGLGALIQVVGTGLLILSLIGLLLRGPMAGFWLIVAIGMLVGGGYAKYVSKQSVRTTR